MKGTTGRFPVCAQVRHVQAQKQRAYWHMETARRHCVQSRMHHTRVQEAAHAVILAAILALASTCTISRGEAPVDSSQPRAAVGNLPSEQTSSTQRPGVTERPPELYRLQCALSAHPYRKPSGRPTARFVVPIDSVPFRLGTTCRQQHVHGRATALVVSAPSTGYIGTAPS